jgi:hypothetical protein
VLDEESCLRERKKTIINLIAELIVFGHLGIRLNGNPLPKKPHSSMSVWVLSIGFSKYTCV